MQVSSIVKDLKFLRVEKPKNSQKQKDIRLVGLECYKILSVTEDFRFVIVKTPFKIKVSILQSIKKEVTWQPKDELLFGFKAESKKLNLQFIILHT